MKKIKVKIFLMGLSIVFTVGVSELLIGRFAHQMTYSQAYNYQYRCFKTDDLLPYSLLPNYSCLMLSPQKEFNVKATINSLGYRNKEFSLEKKSGTKRILVMGDSFTFGVGIGDGETYPYQLEEALKGKGYSDTEVINAGYADGFSPDSYYLYYKERGIKLQPDIVVLGFFVYNDITDVGETVWQKTDNNGLPTKIASCCRHVEDGFYRNNEIGLKYRFPLLRESQVYLLIANFLKKYIPVFESGYLPTRDELKLGCAMTPTCLHTFSAEENKVNKVIKAINDLSAANNIKFVVMLIPLEHQLFPEKYNFWYLDKNDLNFIQKRLIGYYQQNNINYLDLYPVFLEKKGQGIYFLPYDLHFNKDGNRLTADTLADYLLKNNYLLSK